MNNQSLVPFFVTGTLLMVVFVFFLIAFLIVQKGKQNKQENEMLYARIDEKERTMQTISMEIHDNVNQMLNLTRMTLRMINKHAVPEQVELLKQAGDILDNLIIDVHNISHTLNTEYLKKERADRVPATRCELGQYLQEDRMLPGHTGHAYGFSARKRADAGAHRPGSVEQYAKAFQCHPPRHPAQLYGQGVQDVHRR